MEKRNFVRICYSVDGRVYEAAEMLFKANYPRRKMEGGSLKPDADGRRKYYLKGSLTDTELKIFKDVLFRYLCSRRH